MDEPARVWLFVPAQRREMVQKAPTTGAEVLIYDLEDSVPTAERVSARAILRDLLGAERRTPVCQFVRLSSGVTGEIEHDLEAIVQPSLDGLMVPKVSEPGQIEQLSIVLSAWEARRSVQAGSVKLVPLIENAAGLLRAHEIAQASARVVGLALGAEDYEADLVDNAWLAEPPEAALTQARGSLAVAAAAAGVLPIDRVWRDIRDAEGLARDTNAGASLGFGAKLAIHPGQVGTIRESFQPSRERVAEARRVLTAAEEAAREGLGAALVDGAMIDKPVVRRAERVLRMAEAQREEA